MSKRGFEIYYPNGMRRWMPTQGEAIAELLDAYYRAALVESVATDFEIVRAFGVGHVVGPARGSLCIEIRRAVR